MTRKEFEEKIVNENLEMEGFSIELNELREEISVMGCVFNKGKWVIYQTDEKNEHASIIEEYEKEDDAFNDFYKLVKFQIEMEKL